MGQRLVVTVNYCEEEIVKIYYHWSAYTESALMETKQILDELLDENNNIKDLKLRLIRFCERNGGGIKNGKDSDEWKYIQSVYPNETFKEDNISRNYGLIALSEEGMADLQNWSEGDVYINLDEGEVNFGVYGWYEYFEEYLEERKSWDDEFEGIKLEDIPDIGHDLGVFNVCDIDAIIAAIDKTSECVVRNGNEIYELTE